MDNSCGTTKLLCKHLNINNKADIQMFKRYYFPFRIIMWFFIL